MLGRNTESRSFNGDFAEMIIFERVLTPGERENVGFYLNSKYAFTQGAKFGVYRDSNGNGITDNIERGLGYDPYSFDSDGDAVPSTVELANGTDPFSADTDHDGISDGLDYYPLDPTRSEPPILDSNDHTAPVVTLVSPAQAMLN